MTAHQATATSVMLAVTAAEHIAPEDEDTWHDTLVTAEDDAWDAAQHTLASLMRLDAATPDSSIQDDGTAILDALDSWFRLLGSRAATRGVADDQTAIFDVQQAGYELAVAWEGPDREALLPPLVAEVRELIEAAHHEAGLRCARDGWHTHAHDQLVEVEEAPLLTLMHRFARLARIRKLLTAGAMTCIEATVFAAATMRCIAPEMAVPRPGPGA